VVMEGRSVGSYRALNEVFLGRGSSGRVVTLGIGVNGRRLLEFSGDGVVIATPTGSTAYALSAGGPVVSPSVSGFLVVPVSPHTLASRSFVVGSADLVEIALPDAARADACLALDGDLVPCRRRIERVTVAQDERDVLLVKLDGRDFFDVVAQEFLGC
jgi:NAD+ kinase